VGDRSDRLQVIEQSAEAGCRSIVLSLSNEESTADD